MARAVLDASAVLTLIFAETGADLVAGYVGGALISTVNFQEVAKILQARGMAEELARPMLNDLGMEIRPHDVEDAWSSARLFPHTMAKGRGIADRTCMALAIATGLPAITADRVWAELAIPGLTVILAR